MNIVIISIDNQVAQILDYDETVDTFATVNARKIFFHYTLIYNLLIKIICYFFHLVRF